MGKLIPFSLERINTCSHDGQLVFSRSSRRMPNPQTGRVQNGVFYYMRENVFVYHERRFRSGGSELRDCGVGNRPLLFSIDDPFGDNFEAVEFLNKAQLSQENKEKLAHGNAERVLKLLPETTSRRGELRS